MDAVKTLLRRYLKAAWRRRWLGLGIAWVVCVAGWAGISMMPNQYVSSARIYVDTDAVLTPLLKGLAVDSAGEDWVRVLQQTLLSRPNVEKLISKTDLDLTVTSPTDRDALVQSLMKNITVSQQRGDPKGVFWISYTGTNPKLAQNVVQTLLNIFIENASSGNRTAMANARVFLQRQIASYAEQLQAADQRRAAFRTKYPDIFAAGIKADMPGQDPLDAVRTKIAQLEGSLQDKTLMAAAYEKQLSGPKKAGSAAGRAGGANPQLAAAEAKLRMLEMRYTDTFPDVLAAKQEVEALRASPSVAASTAQALAANTNDQIQVKLAETNGEIASIQRQLTDLKTYQTKLEDLQRQRPTVLAEYENMDRDYNVLQKSYDELISRLQSANIGAAADTQADKVQVRIVDPPIVPTIPVGPNRLLFVSVVLVVGIGLGFALPVLLSQLDQSFWVVEDLRSLGLPVVGGISLLTGGATGRHLFAAAGFSVAVLLLAAVYGGLLFQILRTTAVV